MTGNALRRCKQGTGAMAAMLNSTDAYRAVQIARDSPETGGLAFEVILCISVDTLAGDLPQIEFARPLGKDAERCFKLRDSHAVRRQSAAAGQDAQASRRARHYGPHAGAQSLTVQVKRADDWPSWRFDLTDDLRIGMTGTSGHLQARGAKLIAAIFDRNESDKTIISPTDTKPGDPNLRRSLGRPPVVRC